MSAISTTNIIDVQDTTLMSGQRAVMITTPEGNIVIPVGVGSFVAGGKVYVEAQKKVVDTTTTAANIAVNDNTRYEYTQPLTSLTLTSVPSSSLPSSIVFVAGSGFTMSIPGSTYTIGKLLGGMEPFIEGKRYAISMSNNEAIAYTFNEVVE